MLSARLTVKPAMSLSLAFFEGRSKSRLVRMRARLGGWRVVNTNRWWSLSCETPLLGTASEKYGSFGAPSGLSRERNDAASCDICALWAAKSIFRGERHPERKTARLDGGGRSLARTRLHQKSLLTGKNTGNIAT